MPYLNLDLNFFSHPKTMRLVGLLGRGSEVLPLKLWCHCGAHHADNGRLIGYAAQEIEAIIGWWGKQGEAVTALTKLGFIDEVSDGFQIHDWKEHEGHLLAFKKRAKQAAEKRWGIKLKHATSNAKRKPKQCPNQPYQPTVPTVPNKERTMRFVPPTIDEVSSFCLTDNIKIDPQGFIDFYGSKGWMVGKNKMTDWKMAARRAQDWESMQKKTVLKTGREIADDIIARTKGTENVSSPAVA